MPSPNYPIEPMEPIRSSEKPLVRLQDYPPLGSPPPAEPLAPPVKHPVEPLAHPIQPPLTPPLAPPRDDPPTPFPPLKAPG
jgi:hypothetical protein